jgi:ethanolamine utilization protein EutA
MPAEGRHVGDAAWSGRDQVVVRSAGLDIGSATSHMVISELLLERQGIALSNQFVVTGRAEVFRSPIFFTPYRPDGLIDGAELQTFFDGCYRDAGFGPADVDTGVVIVTGEAAERPNAEELVARFAARAGVLCVAAGPHFEALLAAHGSGAVAASAAGPVLNIDVGGGTTKVSVVSGGLVERTGAVAVGARLVAHDDSLRLTRVDPGGRRLLEALGSDADVGDLVSHELLAALARLMVDVIARAVGRERRDRFSDDLWVTEPLAEDGLADLHVLRFSGGVAEYVYGRETESFGDLGALLGAELRARFADAAADPTVVDPHAGIRATVLGAGQYGVQAGGLTSFVDDTVLPVAGLKVLPGRVAGGRPLADQLRSAARQFDLDDRTPVVYALTMPEDYDYAVLREVGDQLLEVAHRDSPLFVTTNADVAYALGRVLRVECGWTGGLVVLDCIEVGDLDYLDIGPPVTGLGSVLVTVKSLTFATGRPHGASPGPPATLSQGAR